MMAITESLPVGNEVAAAGAPGKAGTTVDVGLFAASFAAAGGGGDSKGQGKGTVAAGKGQQDVAGWMADRGGQTAEVLTEAWGQEAIGGSAKQGGSASLVDKQEVGAAAAGPQVSAETGAAEELRSDVVAAAGAINTSAQSPAGRLAEPGVDGDKTSVPVGAGGAQTAVIAPVKPVQEAGSTGSVEVAKAVPAALPKVAEGDAEKPVVSRPAVSSPAPVQTDVELPKIAADVAEKLAVASAAPVQTKAETEVAAAAIALSPAPGALVESKVDGSVDGATVKPGLAPVQVQTAASATGKLPEPVAMRELGGQEAARAVTAGGEQAAGVAQTTPAPKGEKALGAGAGNAVAVRQKAVASGPSAAVGGKSEKTHGVSAPAPESTMTGALSTPAAGQGTVEVAVAPSAAQPAAASSELKPMVFEEIGEVEAPAATAVGEAAGHAVSAAATGTQAVAPTVSQAVRPVGTESSGATTSHGHGTGVAKKVVEPVAVGSAAVPVSVGDGASMIAVPVAPAVAVPAAVPAPQENAQVAVAQVGAATGVKKANGPAGPVGSGAVKDKDAKTAGAGKEVAPLSNVRGRDEVAAAVNPASAPATSTVVDKSVARAPAAPAGHAVGTVEAAGAGTTMAGVTGHMGAVGWTGSPAALAAPVVRPEVPVSGAAAASTSAGTRMEDGGLTSGSSSGLIGSGQGHTTLQATPTVLEVGVPGGTHGWLKIRAELGEGGAVQASVSSATQAGQETLRRELPAMSAYLQSEHVPVTLQVAHGVAGAVSGGEAVSSGLGTGLGAGFGAGLGSGPGGQGSQAEAGRGELSGMTAGSGDAGGGGRQPGAEASVAGAVTAARDGVSAAIGSAERDWTTPLGYGGGSHTTGGSWVNVIA